MASIFQALYSGVNGINANGTATAIIGDNISNVNTHGYKSARPEFEDIIAGNTETAGLGSRVSGTTTNFSQGGFESTSVVTDLAIDGRGFFPVYDVTNQREVYTRHGQFEIDENGYLVNQQGNRLMAFGVDSNENIETIPEQFQFDFDPVLPRPTGEVAIEANLNASSVMPAAFDVTDPIATSNFASGIGVHDSIGKSHLATVYFRKNSTTANQWQWFAVVDQAEITGATADMICASGVLNFTLQGELQTATVTTNDFDFIGAAQNQVIAFDFGTNTATGNGVDGITQFGANSSLNAISQDGYSSGVLSTIEVNSEGVISGNYTNGTSQVLGQVVVSLFANEQGLVRAGDNSYIKSLESGEPLTDAARAGGRGSILSQTLEQSNVDLAAELIRMVIVQRGFQANTRTISVVNELMGALVNLAN